MTDTSAALHPGVWGYALAAAGYVLLAVLLLTSWRGRLQGGLLLALSLVSALWAGSLAYALAYALPLSIQYAALELLRSGVALLFLYKILPLGKGLDSSNVSGLRWMAYAVAAVWVCVLALHGYTWFYEQSVAATLGYDPRFAGHLVLALFGLVLVEHLFRNSPPQQRWAIKYLCLGLGGLFAYDFYLYSNAVLFNTVDRELWDVRGFIHILVIPLIAVSAARNPQWSLDVFVSRRMVFHSAAILGAGTYLTLMALGGYAIRFLGGDWGTLAQVIFLFGAALLLFALMFSGQVRARVRVFLSKHFFNYKYDYREEWLSFIGALASEEPGPGLSERILQALAAIVDSPGGLLWVVDEQTGRFELASEWNATGPAAVAADDALVEFLKTSEWLVDLDEWAVAPEVYASLTLPAWLAAIERAWLVIPLFQNRRMIGMVLLLQSRAAHTINWEDRDLLKTAASQAASYLALSRASAELANARQFEAFNRLSAYVVHDLKNVVGQLSLVVANAKKFGHKQEFVDDAMATVDNAVNKMQRMLTQLRQGREAQRSSVAVRLSPLLEEVVRQRSAQQPVPVFSAGDTGVSVIAEHDRLAAVIEHVVQNAQEASAADGRVELRLTSDSQNAVIEIQDNGCGMDEKFIRDRLFRPFDTTKGNAGMGIGAYECREFVRGLGGEVQVHSRPGEGTLFRLSLPKVPG
ncbi:hypothetical protein Tel_13775 [Candidatus Tenderia electrophaga]|jgi:putative PEP-CTERM system histidine kinase|uniref:histidine kinase n=1 Tax=Candidatus Tenderia electrophaga TaxID=1748243 RepID=A0A0S2TG61_9GAMM|nr:hypothetical protein Tel_13775 [Candidatus Tenderia electrophaga]